MQNLHAVPVMSKRQKWFLLLGGVVVAIALMALVTQDREPSYQGRSLSNWIASYDPSNLEIDSTTNQVIAAAMRQFGTNALPFLLQWLRYETPRSGVKSTLRSLVRKLPYGMTPDALASWAHIDQQEFRAFSAVAAFALLGDDARPAIPELSKLMNDPALSLASQRAILALGFVGKDAIPVLSVQLANPNAPHRADVAQAFGRFPALATNDDSALALLMRCLEDLDQGVREAAVGSLGILAKRCHLQPAGVVPALTNCLRADSPVSLRSRATWALGAYGDQAREAVPHLLRLTAAPEFILRIRATNALLQIAPQALTNAPAR